MWRPSFPTRLRKDNRRGRLVPTKLFVDAQCPELDIPALNGLPNRAATRPVACGPPGCRWQRRSHCAARWRADLPPAITEFVVASRRVARRRRIQRVAGLVGAALSLWVILFLGLMAYGWWQVRALEAQMEATQTFVTIPAGCFEMGSSMSETERWNNEGPDGPVPGVCPSTFAIGKYEVTHRQWSMLQKLNFGKVDDYPVDNVSWDDIQGFLSALNFFSQHRYRLPSEAEWEYAARGGTKTARYWGERAEDGCAYENMADLTFKKINPDSNIANMANCEDGHATTAPVGSFKPNPIGLYDMLGNVTEFVADCYVVNLRELPKDGRAMEKENCFDHTIRGGNFWFDTRQVRAAYRTSIDQTTRMRNIGFRLVRTITP